MKKKIKQTKQYGITNKEVLNNKVISANAKGLYVYLCARSGNKGICNPSVHTICKDLNINENTFHKLKNELINNKIISIQKVGTGIEKRNNYILLQKQDKVGYGTVYLDILKDNKIPLKSKAIYGLLSCFAGNRLVAYPTAKAIYNILKISRNTYFKSLKLLKDLKYVITKQLHINGRFSRCNYYINDKKPNKENTRFIFKGLKNKNSNKNTTTLSKLSLNNNIGTEEDTYKVKEKCIMQNIEYEGLTGLFANNKKALTILENILSILTSYTYSDSKSLKSINLNGTRYDVKTVQVIFNKLNYDNVKYVVDNILSKNRKIKNLRSYLGVSLLNSFYQVKEKNYAQMGGF